eukprot:Rmarinus@m.4797
MATWRYLASTGRQLSWLQRLPPSFSRLPPSKRLMLTQHACFTTGYKKKKHHTVGKGEVGFGKQIEDVQKEVDARQQAVHENESAVNWAIGANIAALVLKAYMAVITKSDTMIGSTFHSLGDVFNQIILKYGLVRASRPPSPHFPHGHSREVYVWSLVAACGFFFCGGGVSVYEGVTSLIDGQHTDPRLAYQCLAALAACAVPEVVSWIQAFKAVRTAANASNMSLWEYGRTGANPFGFAILLEDTASLTSLGVAFTFLSLHYATGNPVWDSVGSIIIGGIQLNVASFLIWKNSQSLAGRSIPTEQYQRLLYLLENDPVVMEVNNLVAEMSGVNTVHVSANIDFNGLEVSRRFLRANRHRMEEILHIQSGRRDSLSDAHEMMSMYDSLLRYGDGVIEQVALETDRLEDLVRQVIPEAKYIHIETH